MIEMLNLPQSSNLALTGPYRLTLDEFYSLPVPEEQQHARNLILSLQEAIESLVQEGVQTIDDDALKPVHRFSKGIYTRELTMPAGTVLVGKRHAQEHIVMLTLGHCTVFTERGQEELQAPCTFISPAGEKRVFFVHEPTTIVTVHRTDETDLDLIERDLILNESPPQVVNRERHEG